MSEAPEQVGRIAGNVESRRVVRSGISARCRRGGKWKRKVAEVLSFAKGQEQPEQNTFEQAKLYRSKYLLGWAK